ncbi:MAG: hypothetical protein WCH74_10035, partial [Chloroflexota bacterium]
MSPHASPYDEAFEADQADVGGVPPAGLPPDDAFDEPPHPADARPDDAFVGVGAHVVMPVGG